MPMDMRDLVVGSLLNALEPPDGYLLTETPGLRGGVDLRILKDLDTVLQLKVEVNSYSVRVEVTSPLLAIFVVGPSWSDQGGGFVGQFNEWGRALKRRTYDDELRGTWLCPLSSGVRLRALLEDMKALVKAATDNQGDT